MIRMSVKQGYVYEAVGLRIWSNVPLTPLVTIDDSREPDVRVQIVQRHSLDIARTPSCEKGVWFQFKGECRIAVTDSSHIFAEYDPDEVEFRTFLGFLYGPGFAIMLAQRGLFPLHLSAVAFGGSALAFFGPSGAGKSTTAANLVFNAGGKLIADDLGLIRFSNGTPLIWGIAERGLKLFSGSVQALALEQTIVGIECDEKRKSIIGLSTDNSVASAMLKGMVLLEVSDLAEDVTITRMSLPESLIESRKLLFIPQIGVKMWEFEDALAFLASVVSSVPFFRVVRPRRSDGDLVDVLACIRELGLIPLRPDHV